MNVRPGKSSGFSLLQNRCVSGWSRAVPVWAAMVRNRALFMYGALGSLMNVPGCSHSGRAIGRGRLLSVDLADETAVLGSPAEFMSTA